MVVIELGATWDAGERRLAVRAVARAADGAELPAEPLTLNVAVFERGLATEVGRGENRGRTLRHDFVARRLLPTATIEDGEAVVRPELDVPDGWRAGRLGVAGGCRGVARCGSTRRPPPCSAR